MNTLAKRMLNNKGLFILTVPEERLEMAVIGSKPYRKIKFAFFQKMFDGTQIPFWHVVDPHSKSFNSTLSMEGLKEWGILK